MDYQEYFDKVFGGWTGRVAGSQLGAPMEFRPFPYIQQKYCNRWKTDISYYVKPANPSAVNDDELYQIASLIALEKYGIDITAGDIANEWQYLLDPKQYPVELTGLKNVRAGLYPPECASEQHGNFIYDAIQGQMRGDIWGLLAPNCPATAAQYAKMDGSITSLGSGIDGQVFIAALVANAFGISEIEALISESLQQISPVSLYRQFIEKCLAIYQRYSSWRDGRRMLVKAWNAELKSLMRQSRSIMRRLWLLFFPQIHVLPNGGIIVLSLLYGQKAEDSFGRPLCIGAMMGYDTDCNCGNLGTIMGTILGESRIPTKWKAPLQNRFNTYVRGHEHWTISGLSAKICEIGMKVVETNCPGRKIEGD